MTTGSEPRLMSYTRQQANTLMRHLHTSATWNDEGLASVTESLLRRCLRIPVRQIYRSDSVLAFHLDLKKSVHLHPSFGESVFILYRLRNKMSPDDLNRLLEEIQMPISREGLPAQWHFLFRISKRSKLQTYVQDTFPNTILSNAKGFREILFDQKPTASILHNLEKHSLSLRECPFLISQWSPIA